ncbi:c-type cytochrome [Aquincola sp. S2]|uniref:C-type cytochrome n=1 Tax=Pseudaquabacterium terrae TaxID=2732868 RepID=A0ABX2EIQ5_9BURK|nr:cytochrome c peroxidase [Aquabacterium terrae]NRF68467.1 c-type cytochrome [Aquabacterium terrae]
MRLHRIFTALSIVLSAAGALAAEPAMSPTKDDMKWLLPKVAPAPADNKPTPARVELGKMLFFDPRLSSEKNLSCASCHSPLFGWSDGLPTAKGFKSKVLGRASPTVVNSAFTSLQMWDGRRASLEDQAMGPMESMDEMAMDLSALFKWLNSSPQYKAAFDKAYPGEAIDKTTTSKAIAAYERTIISADSPFDRWLRGDKKAMTTQQVRGFRLFNDPNKGNCMACHSAPNFTDGGFHNVGLAAYGKENPDVGRFAIKALPSMKGAFKTPTLRDIALTAPYFHDGSAATLMEVMEHYNKGGITKTDLSPNMKPLNLSDSEMKDIVSFMEALTTPPKAVSLPVLPPN